ncbi:MAG: tRNA (adenosine(37)-N6)-threonylcarbamoyltransferase complex dimerization subunit type 1 TsaB [Stellaceae bacterium]
MKVLGLDCTGASCSAAVAIAGAIRAHRFAAMERGQAEALMPMVQAVLDEAALGVAQLDLIAVTIGPGSFTGVRTGLAAARGLGLAARRPLMGVTSFAAVAEAVRAQAGGRPLAVALESKRQELFLQLVGPEGPGDGALVPPEQWGAFVPVPAFLAGDGAVRLAAALARPRTDILSAAAVDAAHVACLAARRWRTGLALPAPRPLYLRAPDTTSAAPPA